MKAYLEYAEGASVAHRMNPTAKLLCSFVLCFACFCTSNLLFLVAASVLGFMLAASCGMVRRIAAMARTVAAFSLVLALVQVLTTQGGTPLVQVPWGVIGTSGLVAALTTVVRLVAASIPLFLTFYVTEVSDIANALVKNVRMPYRYAFAFTSTMRFIPTFMEDMAAIMEAQTARGVRFDRGGIVGKVRLMAPLCVPLLVSSVRKAGDAAIAVELRGFELRGRTSGYREYPFALRDYAAAFLSAAMLAVSISLSFFLP